MIKAIIFDFGGVLSTDDSIGKFWEKNHKILNVDMEEANNVGIPIWLEARTGKIDSNIFWEKLGALSKMSPEAFRQYFIGQTGFRDKLYNFIKQNLHGKYKLAILSNQIESWLEPILEEKNFRDFFEVVVTSYNTGLAKPDIKIYEDVVQKLHVEPKECIYIDDMIKNLEPAKNLGMSVIEFREYDSFLREFHNLLK